MTGRQSVPGRRQRRQKGSRRRTVCPRPSAGAPIAQGDEWIGDSGPVCHGERGAVEHVNGRSSESGCGEISARQWGVESLSLTIEKLCVDIARFKDRVLDDRLQERDVRVNAQNDELA